MLPIIFLQVTSMSTNYYVTFLFKSTSIARDHCKTTNDISMHTKATLYLIAHRHFDDKICVIDVVYSYLMGVENRMSYYLQARLLIIFCAV